MPGVGSDIASSFGLKKGGKKKVLIQEVCDDPEPEDAAPSPKQKLTQTLGAEARELLTGGSAGRGVPWAMGSVGAVEQTIWPVAGSNQKLEFGSAPMGGPGAAAICDKIRIW